MFDAISDDAGLRAFAERTGGGRHHFRFIVSPEDGTEMEPLRVTSSSKWSTTSERGWTGSELIAEHPTIRTSI